MKTSLSTGLPFGYLSLFQGAEPVAYAALLEPLTEIKGKFIWEDCKVKDWVNG